VGPVRSDLDSTFLDALAERVVLADGAMGTMLQAADLVLDDFAGLEGCNEILNDTRPDVVRHIHRAYLEAGADAVETNTFGANLPNLADYGIADRIRELAEKGARIAREVADETADPGRPRFVLGSVGPGTKLPTLGHESFVRLRDAYAECGRGLAGVRHGVDEVSDGDHEDAREDRTHRRSGQGEPPMHRPEEGVQRPGDDQVKEGDGEERHDAADREAQ